VIGCAVLAGTVVHLLGRPRDLRRLCGVLVAFGLVFSGLGVWQALTRSGLFPSPDGAARAHAVFVTPNTFAGFLVIVLPLAGALALTERRMPYRVLLWAATGVLGVALALTRSRGGAMAAVLAALFLAWEVGRIWPLRLSGRLVAVGGVLAAVVLGGGVLAALRPGVGERLAGLLDPLGDATFRDRARYWDSAARMIEERPALGVGLDAFHVAYPQYQHPALAGTRQWFAHNDYLQTAAELGLVGLGALGILLLAAGRLAARTLGSRPDRVDGVLAAGFAAGALAALVQSTVDYNLYVPGTALPLFACLGAIAAIAARHRRQADLPTSRRRTREQRKPDGRQEGDEASSAIRHPLVTCGDPDKQSRPFIGCSGQTVLSAEIRERCDDASRGETRLSVPALRAARRAWLQAAVIALAALAILWAVRPLIAQRLLQADRANARAAVLVCPESARFWSYLGDRRTASDPNAAARCYRTAIRRSPRTADFHARLGRLGHKRLGGLDRGALDELRRARDLAPNRALFRLWLAEALLDAGHHAAARRELLVALARCRPNPKLRERIERLLRGRSLKQTGSQDGRARTDHRRDAPRRP
jgi:O-antigen ligase